MKRLPQVATSAALYAIGFILTTMLHELAHAVVSMAAGRHPVLYQNHVSSDDASVASTVVVALAGPIFSLVQGLVLLPVIRRWKDGPPVRRALLTWLCFHGWMNATGYLFTTAFVSGGDLGKAMRLLNVPTLGLIALSGLGFWTIRVAARLVYPAFVALLPADEREPTNVRNRALLLFAVAPWPLGVLIVLPTAFPLPHWISLVYVLVAGIGAIWFTEFSKIEDRAEPGGRPLPDGWVVWPWLVVVALEAFSLIVLRPGISFG